MTTVFIKGIGLIGSSIARAIRQAHPSVKILASDLNEDSLQYALDQRIIDKAANDLDGTQNADVIILATPVSQIIKDLNTLSRMQLKTGVIVTDVGSTKQTVMQASKVLTDHGVTFIGGHPMAGSHLTGAKAGKAGLFKGAYYFLILGRGRDDERAVHRLEDLLSGLQVKWKLVDAQRHDQIVAQISHVPHVIAATLMNQTQGTLGDDLKLAAGGFKSVTRIAASDPTMWSAIMLNNQELIRKQLQDYITELQAVKKLIDQGDRDALFDFFKKAQAGRRQLDQPAE